LTSVWGSSASDVWAVGYGGLVIHYDGTAWSRVDAGTTNDLHGVSGTSASDAWLVGEMGLIEHWDGVRWSCVDDATLPALVGMDGGAYEGDAGIGGYHVPLESVFARAPNDVWAGCDSTPPIHFDGQKWSPVPGVMAGPMIAFGPSDAWAGNGAVAHWDGAGWTELGLNVVQGQGDVTGIAGRVSNDVWMVGLDYQSFPTNQESGMVLHWDGATITDMAAGGGPSNDFVYAAWESTAGNVWTARYYTLAAPGVGAPVWTWSAGSWTPHREAPDHAYAGVWGGAEGDVWFVGGVDLYSTVNMNPVLVHWDGTTFHEVAVP
jgi:hypothetical protein